MFQLVFMSDAAYEIHFSDGAAVTLVRSEVQVQSGLAIPTSK